MTKILLVEDDKSLREIYGVRLLAEGYDIVSAGDGEEALAMAIKEKPSLIISDVMMPKISGFDMLDILRSTTETKNIKVIMMTALSSDDQRARGEQLGADRYLVKSQVGIEDVVRTVHEVLEDNTAAAAQSDNTVASATEDTPVTPQAELSNNDVDSSNESAPQSQSTEVTPEQAPANDGGALMQPPVQDYQPTENVGATSTDSVVPVSEDAGPLPPQPTETADSGYTSTDVSGVSDTNANDANTVDVSGSNYQDAPEVTQITDNSAPLTPENGGLNADMTQPVENTSFEPPLSDNPSTGTDLGNETYSNSDQTVTTDNDVSLSSEGLNLDATVPDSSSVVPDSSAPNQPAMSPQPDSALTMTPEDSTPSPLARPQGLDQESTSPSNNPQ